MQKVKNVIKDIISYFFPKTCFGCGEIIEDDKFLCDCCYKTIVITNFDKVCLKCGLNKDNCDCNETFFHFSGCVSPYINEGVMQKILYTAKFCHKDYYLKYFSKSMALAINEQYSTVKFDGICYVPMPIKKRLKRGFNQSEVLAKQLSDLLNIPLIKDALYCKTSNGVQHTLNGFQRFTNAHNLYGFSFYNNNKTLLLVDDIKTTGATLDECSRQLLFSGADSVYCATALITPRKNENSKKSEEK